MRIGMMDNLPSGYPREGKKDSPDYACMAVCRGLPTDDDLPCPPLLPARDDVSVAVLRISGKGAATLKPWEAEETLLPLASLSLPCTLAR